MTFLQPLTPLLSLSEGDLLGGRYRIESETLARPSSVQYEATDLTRGTRVSVQVLTALHGAEDAELDSARASFLEGAAQAKALVGPHVARVLDMGLTVEGHAWIVRERIASPRLAAH